MTSFTGVKVFTTTLARDREAMGETVDPLARRAPRRRGGGPRDAGRARTSQFHCLSIVVFYRDRARS